jgi:hypothetical protein
MSLRIRRGLEADRTSITPEEGEFLYTTDDKKLYMGDGTTAGGNLITGGGGGGGGIQYATASGTDSYTATISGVSSYNDGDAYIIKFTNGNTTTSSLNINSLGAIPLHRNNDGPLIGGDIWSDSDMMCVYDATTTPVPVFKCIGTSPNSLFSYVTNADSVSLTKGMPVYAFGGTGDRLTVKRANNTSDATSAQTIGLVYSTSIAAGQKGIIIMQGQLDGLSIVPTSTWADGDPVYLGSTAGTITKTKPYAPNHLVYLGFVTSASPGSAGRIYVKIQNGYEMNELHDVQSQSAINKDILYRDTTVSPNLWKPASIATILGYTPGRKYYREHSYTAGSPATDKLGYSPTGVIPGSDWTIITLTINAAGVVTSNTTAFNQPWT